MEIIIVVIAILMAVVGSFFQILLIFEGLSTVGQLILPSSWRPKSGWYSRWGGWHLLVFLLIFKYFAEESRQDIEKFPTVAFQIEGIRSLFTWIVLPLVASFALSQVHALLIQVLKKRT